MGDALRGVDGFAAAHADQKIRLEGRNLSGKTVHRGLGACAAERKRAEHLHAAALNPFL